MDTNKYMRVSPTKEETAAYRAKNNGHTPGVYRIVCKDCGKRMWGSGLGIASHNRAEPAHKSTDIRITDKVRSAHMAGGWATGKVVAMTPTTVQIKFTEAGQVPHIVEVLKENVHQTLYRGNEDTKDWGTAHLFLVYAFDFIANQEVAS